MANSKLAGVAHIKLTLSISLVVQTFWVSLWIAQYTGKHI